VSKKEKYQATATVLSLADYERRVTDLLRVSLSRTCLGPRTTAERGGTSCVPRTYFRTQLKQTFFVTGVLIKGEKNSQPGRRKGGTANEIAGRLILHDVSQWTLAYKRVDIGFAVTTELKKKTLVPRKAMTTGQRP